MLKKQIETIKFLQMKIKTMKEYKINYRNIIN